MYAQIRQAAVVTPSASYNASIGRQLYDVTRPHPGRSRDLLDIARYLRQSGYAADPVCVSVCLSEGGRRDYSKKKWTDFPGIIDRSNID